MGFYVVRVKVPFRTQLLWAAVIWCWPWHIQHVRQLLTNPHVTEVMVHRKDSIITYCHNAYDQPLTWRSVGDARHLSVVSVGRGFV